MTSPSSSADWPTCPSCGYGLPYPADLVGAADKPKTWTRWRCSQCKNLWNR